MKSCVGFFTDTVCSSLCEVTVEGRSKANLDKLQVCESSDVEVRCVLLQSVAVVELGIAPAEGERVRPVGSTQRGRAVHQHEMGW